MMRIGLIGLGTHGLRYAKHLVADVVGLELAAVCRRDADAVAAVARQFGVRGFTDAAQLIDDDAIDAVLIVTPPPSHLPLATLALERGKAVLLEKPLTWTLPEAMQLQQAVQRTQGKLFLAQSLRYSKSLRMAAQEMAQLGEIRSFTASQRLPRTTLAWQHDATPHPMGSILNTGVHLYDLVRWMLGAEFATVYTRARCIENPHQEDLFKTLATLRGRDTLVALEIAKSTNSRSSNLEIVGEHGQLWVDYQLDAVTLVRGGERTVLREAGTVYTIPLLLADFARAVAQGATMPIGVADGVRTMEVVDASYRSMQSGRAESVVVGSG
jgi:predicted dehydrogenase